MLYTECMTTTLQVRTNVQAKKTAQRILEKQGMNLSTAVNIYLLKIIEKNGIPFEVVTENGLTLAEERKILREMAWAKKHGKRYNSAKEMHEDIHKE